MDLRRKDPNKWYVWVCKTSAELGPDAYEDMGYEIVRHHQDGVKAVGATSARKEGDPIERQGAVLMSCPLERHKELEEKGPYGNTGTDLARRYEEQVISQQAAFPGESGLSPRHVHAYNETTKLKPISFESEPDE